MNTAKHAPETPDMKLAAVCGLFCRACSLYIGSTEEPERLDKISVKLGLPVSELECLGCRSDKLGFFCRIRCKMKKCAAEKGIDFCGQCGEYPCAELKEFQSQMPHRIELWEAQKRIVDAGWETWYAEMLEHYSCGTCGTVNSAYDPACRSCGADPGNEYVRLHREQLDKAGGRLGR